MQERLTMPITSRVKQFKIGVVEIVGDTICVAQDDGQRLFEVLNSALTSNQTVALSFSNVESLTTAFLNAAIGQLLRHHDSAFLRENLTFLDLSSEQLRLLREVIERAKLYFSDPERFDAARAQALEL